MSDTTLWECSPETIEKPLDQLRVADEFKLVCTGEELSDKISDKAQFKIEPILTEGDNALSAEDKQSKVDAGKGSVEIKEKTLSKKEESKKKASEKAKAFVALKNKYKLKILNVDISDYSRVDLKVTSYVAGEHKFTGLFLQDGVVKVPIKEFDLKIISILPKDKQPQVIGPMGPVTLAYPLWLIILLSIALLFISALFFRFFKKTHDRKKLVKELSLHGSHLTPFQEFSKELRSLSRESKVLEKARKSPFSPDDYVKGLVRSYNMYFVREFKIPAHVWSTKETLSEFKSKNMRLSHLYYTSLRSYFLELEKAQQNVSQLSFEDCRQLSEMGLQLISRIHITEKGAQ